MALAKGNGGNSAVRYGQSSTGGVGGDIEVTGDATIATSGKYATLS